MPVDITTITPSFEEFADMIPQPIYGTDLQHKVTFMNKFAVKAANINSEKNWLGVNAFDVYPKEIAVKLIKNRNDVINYKKQIHCEEIVKDQITGDTKIFDTTIAPWRNKKGEVIGTLNISIDITERKKLETETIQQKNELEGKDQIKKEFIKNFSHDVNLPINALVGNLALLKILGKEDEKFTNFINQLNKNVMSLHKMLEQMTDVMLKEQFEHIIVLSDFDLSLMVQDEIELAKASIEQSKKLSVSYSMDKTIPSKLNGDLSKTRQILRNLLSNAIKYTKEGEITLEVKIIDHKEEWVVKFIVTDTGMGIAESDREKIYKRGKRLVSSYETNIHGTGLGLYIVKSNLDLLGGKVDFESVVGKGSTFWVEIPFKKNKN
ncbi:PAS domain-containing sensor histidine kinase [Fastidiosibacter lacustris]|uniref:PAS domain-containing sensor histidine kinase n=1 Tax=Fastidiosibacter lacustris TaxID=2056695 RepID=UPI000E343EF5|nr:PAS domain-containing sensor histidine kinase [Fastidiosibacter lacustris]